jgi:hypothetical protein
MSLEPTPAVQEPQERPFWLSVLRWMVWLTMLAFVVAFAERGLGGAFIYQNF